MLQACFASGHRESGRGSASSSVRRVLRNSFRRNGELGIHVGDSNHNLIKGNLLEEPGRMLVTFVPAGMERFFDRLAELTDFDLDAFRSAAAEQGMEVVGPPLAESDPL